MQATDIGHIGVFYDEDISSTIKCENGMYSVQRHEGGWRASYN